MSGPSCSDLSAHGKLTFDSAPSANALREAANGHTACTIEQLTRSDFGNANRRKWTKRERKVYHYLRAWRAGVEGQNPAAALTEKRKRIRRLSPYRAHSHLSALFQSLLRNEELTDNFKTAKQSSWFHAASCPGTANPKTTSSSAVGSHPHAFSPSTGAEGDNGASPIDLASGHDMAFSRAITQGPGGPVHADEAGRRAYNESESSIAMATAYQEVGNAFKTCIFAKLDKAWSVNRTNWSTKEERLLHLVMRWSETSPLCNFSRGGPARLEQEESYFYQTSLAHLRTELLCPSMKCTEACARTLDDLRNSLTSHNLAISGRSLEPNQTGMSSHQLPTRPPGPRQTDTVTGSPNSDIGIKSPERRDRSEEEALLMAVLTRGLEDKV